MAKVAEAWPENPFSFKEMQEADDLPGMPIKRRVSTGG